MKRKNLFLSLVILAAGGLTSCNGVDFLSNDTTTTDSGKDTKTTDETKTDNTTEQEKENTENEDKESETGGEGEESSEEQQPETPKVDERKQKLLNDTRILNSRGVGFTYLDYDLNEQFKSWDKLIEDKNIVLNSNGKVSTIETDNLGKGVLDLPSNVSIASANTKIETDLIDSVVLGGTTWSEQSKSLLAIGKNARKITLKEGTTTIFSGFFSSLKRLEEVVLPSTVTSIKAIAFLKSSSLKKVNLEDTKITTIENGLFKECTSIEEITFPSTINGKIDYEAFDGCTSLKKVVIPNGINSIGRQAFNNCSALTSNLVINSGVTEIPDFAFNNCQNCVITVNAQVKKVGAKSFYNCKKLTSMDLSKVEQLGGYSFYGSGISSANLVGITENIIHAVDFGETTNLTTVTLPNREISIESSAFKGATKLNTVIASSGTVVTNIRSNAFYNCTSLNNASFLNNSSIKKIQDYAFANCGTITSNGILNLKAKEIGDGAFSGSKVKEVNYVGSDSTFVGFSGSQTFKNCTSLEKVTCFFNDSTLGFPVSPEEFSGCVNLKELSFLIPNTEANADRINWIGRWPEWNDARNMLKDCNKLEKVTFYGTVDAWIKSFYTDFALGGERASFLTNLGSEILDLRKSNVQVICQGGCKEANETGSITLSKSNIISYLNKFKK